VLLASGLIISIGMAISGLTSAMLVEYSELQKELNELEKALFRNLDGTHIAKAKMATALMNALVNAVAPILGALAVLFPILLSSIGIIGFSQGFMLSLLLSILSLFLLGVYLGKNAGNRPIV
jgi:predicted membrane protein (TIGR00267 family)